MRHLVAIPSPAPAPEVRVRVARGDLALAGHLAVPPEARGLVILAGDAALVAPLWDAGFATLRLDPPLDGEQLAAACDWAWLEALPGAHRLAIVGLGTGAAAALHAAAARATVVAAVVAQADRVELAPGALARVAAALLLVTGAEACDDARVVRWLERHATAPRQAGAPRRWSRPHVRASGGSA